MLQSYSKLRVIKEMYFVKWLELALVGSVNKLVIPFSLLDSLGFNLDNVQYPVGLKVLVESLIHPLLEAPGSFTSSPWRGVASSWHLTSPWHLASPWQGARSSLLASYTDGGRKEGRRDSGCWRLPMLSSLAGVEKDGKDELSLYGERNISHLDMFYIV